jgi:hypothetical protein
MNISNLSTDILKGLFKLTTKRDDLLKEVAKIESQLESLIAGKPVKKTAGKGRRTSGKKVATKGKTTKAATTKRSARGGLGKKILKALESAGDAGVKVAELAKSLKVKGTNLHVWFATTGKKHAGIKKVGKGHYRLTSKSSS